MKLFGKASKRDNPLEEITKQIFPNGKSDIISGRNELLEILDHSISKKNAENIFVKSMTIAFLTKEFSVERLQIHLDGYCKGIFSNDELQKFHEYLTARKLALFMGRPKVSKDQNGKYSW
ncbi:MAG: hypothetical protein ACOC22_04185 [bacterium]